MARTRSQQIRANLQRRIRYYEKQGYVFDRENLLGLSWQRQRNLKGLRLINAAQGVRLRNGEIAPTERLRELRNAINLFNAVGRSRGVEPRVYKPRNITSIEALEYITNQIRGQSTVEYLDKRAQTVRDNYLRTVDYIEPAETGEALRQAVMSKPLNVAVEMILQLERDGWESIPAGMAFGYSTGIVSLPAIFRYWGLDPNDYEFYDADLNELQDISYW